jgi:hypothetical protein
MATLESLYDQYLGRAPDAAGAEYWQSELSRGASLADVERAISSSQEAATRRAALATIPAPVVTSSAFDKPRPIKVTAAAVSNILRDQQGGKAEGQWVPESVMSNGQIQYRFEGTLGTPKLADVYGIYASLPDTVSSWGELSERVANLQANNPALRAPSLYTPKAERREEGSFSPTSDDKAYYAALSLAMNKQADGNLSRDQMQQIGQEVYSAESPQIPEYLRPVMSEDDQALRWLIQNTKPKPYVSESRKNSSASPSSASPSTASFSPVAAGTSSYASETVPSSYGTINVGGATTVSGASPMYPEASFSSPYYSAQSPSELFEMAKTQSMQQPPSFQMPVNPALTNWSNPNVPTQNPFAPQPEFFAEGGEVGQGGWQDWMSQSMSGAIPSTYQYPAYGGMPQDVFDWTAPSVSQSKLVQPPRQDPAQFTAPLLTAPVTGGGITFNLPPSRGTTTAATTPTSGGIFAPTPVAPPNTGGITTLPVDNTVEEARLAEQARLAEATRIAEQNRLTEEARLAQQARSTGIQQYYRDILNREADVPGLDYWTQSGESLDQVRSNIALNERNAIEQYYRDILGREADPEGLKYWTESKDTLEQIRGNMQLIKEREAAAAAQTAAVTQAVAQAQAPRGYVNPEGESGTSWYAGDSGD